MACTDDPASSSWFRMETWRPLETCIDLQVLTVSAPPSKRIRGTQAGKTVETSYSILYSILYHYNSICNIVYCCVTQKAVPFDSDSTTIQNWFLIYARWAMRALRTRPRTCHFSIQRAVCAEGWMISGADGADTHGGYV